MEEGAEEEGDDEEGARAACIEQWTEGGEEDWKPFNHEWMTVADSGGGGEEEVALGVLMAGRLPGNYKLLIIRDPGLTELEG